MKDDIVEERSDVEQLTYQVSQQKEGIAQMKRIIERQKETITKLTALNGANGQELQGTKVVLSVLIQREGGEITIADAELSGHQFKLEVCYNPAKLNTTFKSHKRKMIATKQ